MGAVTVKSPDHSFEGQVAGIAFSKGVGTIDLENVDHRGAYGYFQSAGYEIDGETFVDRPPGLYEPRPTPEAPAPGTPENPEGITRGPTSRDAAVVKDAAGPVSDAFMPPTNAGEADPHGPLVVSPGLHAVPPAPIVPGDVHVDDPAVQEAKETDIATKVLVEGQPATIVAETFDPDKNMGPLGLSDPGSVAMGVEAAKENAAAEAVATGNDEPPAKGALKADWVEFAIAGGMSADDAEAATKAELVERFGG